MRLPARPRFPRPHALLVRACASAGLTSCAVLAAFAATTAQGQRSATPITHDGGRTPGRTPSLVAAGRIASSGGLALIIEPGQGMTQIDRDIESARRAVDMTMYELDDTTVEQALVADTRRGVRVRVLLNGGYYGGGGFSENDDAIAYLRANGVTVRSSPAWFALTHQKTITIDGRTSLVMTLNLTSRYYATDRDFAVIDTQPADVAAIEQVFTADWNGRRVNPSTGSGDLLWSPGAGREQLALIDGARTSLDIENEEMADDAITAALCAAARRRVQVRVVMTDEGSWREAFDELAACGVQVRTYQEDAPLYIHAKAIVADARAAFVGSQNFSATSLDANRELGIVTSNRAIVDQLEQTVTSDFAGGSSWKA